MRVVETPLLLCASTKGTDIAKCFLVRWLRRKAQFERIYLCVRELTQLRVVVIGREIFNGEMSILYRDKLSPHPNVVDVTYASLRDSRDALASLSISASLGGMATHALSSRIVAAGKQRGARIGLTRYIRTFAINCERSFVYFGLHYRKPRKFGGLARHSEFSCLSHHPSGSSSGSPSSSSGGADHSMCLTSFCFFRASSKVL
jgi:hypothetical protein